MKLLNKKLFILILLFIGVDVFAQPKPPTGPNAPIFTDHRLRRNIQAPVAPATLLLLGLGATAVGTKVYRNKKQ